MAKKWTLKSGKIMEDTLMQMLQENPESDTLAPYFNIFPEDPLWRDYFDSGELNGILESVSRKYSKRLVSLLIKEWRFLFSVKGTTSSNRVPRRKFIGTSWNGWTYLWQVWYGSASKSKTHGPPASCGTNTTYGVRLSIVDGLAHGHRVQAAEGCFERFTTPGNLSEHNSSQGSNLSFEPSSGVQKCFNRLSIYI